VAPAQRAARVVPLLVADEPDAANASVHRCRPVVEVGGLQAVGHRRARGTERHRAKAGGQREIADRLHERAVSRLVGRARRERTQGGRGGLAAPVAAITCRPIDVPATIRAPSSIASRRVRAVDVGIARSSGAEGSPSANNR
jgi:hypothetical protein